MCYILEYVYNACILLYLFYFIKRISGHRFHILNNGGQLLYQHFNLPDHSILSMGVIVIEKIYHHTNSPSLSTPYRRERRILD